MASKRLQNDLMSLMAKPVEGIQAFPDGDNMLLWSASIVGPETTPYADQKYKLTMEFPKEYPNKPPMCLFRTPIYHPNIDFAGRICLDILKDQWSSVYSVETILLSLQSLLGEPNNSSPLNGQAAELWDTDKEEFKKLVDKRYKLREEEDEDEMDF